MGVNVKGGRNLPGKGLNGAHIRTAPFASLYIPQTKLR